MCMCACRCARVRACVRCGKHIGTHVHTHVYTHVCADAYTHQPRLTAVSCGYASSPLTDSSLAQLTCVWTCVPTCEWTRVWTCVWTRVSTCVWTRVPACVWTRVRTCGQTARGPGSMTAMAVMALGLGAVYARVVRNTHWMIRIWQPVRYRAPP